MLSSLLITLREGLEAALIIGIMLAYLSRTGNRSGVKQVWLGTALAVLASLVAGAAIYLVAEELEGSAEQIFEGSTALLAAGVLTWMIFWMRRQASSIKSNLHAEMQSALRKGASFGLVFLAFVAVVREGVETALFMFAAARTAESPVAFTAGGLVGLALAVILGYSIYKGTSRLNMRAFFNVTGLLLILFAAGLLAHGIHEFNEAGVVPAVIEHVWDTGRVLPDTSTPGRFLSALLGYNSDPSLVEVAGYFAYLAIVLWAYLRPTKRPASR
ncbi:MAG: iron uptake transporter permease EfeU [Dehalococcoidia bacterium]|nr:iron uptake transporter permease EfeU [Dehalococcoidia bacterium]